VVTSAHSAVRSAGFASSSTPFHTAAGRRTVLSSGVSSGVSSVVRSTRQLCTPAASSSFSYVAFAKAYPIMNNLIIATMKTAAADLMAQCVIEKKPVSEVDWRRNFVFCLFGCAYLGAFQYWYQVNIFKRLFPSVERFTNLPIAQKLTDVPGLLALAGQTVLDVAVLTFIYLPTFYTFKASVFSGSWDPRDWVATGLGAYQKNFQKDAYDLVRVWGPADILCFSIPLYLRLPVRHIISFFWTVYLSFVRGKK